MGEKSIEAYPLCWPEGWKRSAYREDSRFKTGFGKARGYLFAELERLGAKRVIVSTNVPLRLDGMPRANVAPDRGDPGVAVYFHRKGKDMVFACDKYFSCADNVHAIAKTIEAMRGIERWGASDMMERAFTGFAQIGDGSDEAWRTVLGFSPTEYVNREDIEARFRSLAKKHHPDAGGDAESFSKLCRARESAFSEITA